MQVMLDGSDEPSPDPQPGLGLWPGSVHRVDAPVVPHMGWTPVVAGRGSAVFVHLARPNRGPTAGCVALGGGELRRLLARLGPRTQIDIRS